jgi:NTP pyrophosphatase (non-canonical NTP hydrolase)
MITHEFLTQLRIANKARLPLFKNKRGEPAHSEPDGSDWSLMTWVNAILGEVGEAANIIKKVERNDFTLEEGRAELGKELADVLIYLDIYAFQIGVEFELHKRPVEDIVSDKLSILMAALAVGLGQLASQAFSLNAVSRNARLSQIANGLGAARVSNILAHLSRIAQAADIDLQSAARAKFNEVSRRVGCEVWL